MTENSELPTHSYHKVVVTSCFGPNTPLGLQPGATNGISSRLSHGFGCTDRRAMIFTASCRVNSPLSDAPQSPDSLPFVPSKSSIQILRKCPATQRGFAVATRHTRLKHLGSCPRMTLEAIGQVDQSRCFHSITVANRVKSSQFYLNFL